MANILDYLNWRGDVPISAAGLTEADDYLLCKIGTLDLRGIVPENGTYIPLSRAVEKYKARGGETYLGVLTSSRIVPAVLAMAEARRFGEVMLSGYRLNISEEQTEQFSALTLRLPGGRHCVTFRGTDDTITGWKENLLMTVMDTIPAQESAAEYLRWAAETYPGTLTVAGHSKGGNMAVYAAASAAEDVQQRIDRVLNVDGPGFLESFLLSPGYCSIRDRIHTFMPQYSIVGSLLYHGSDCTIVKSSAYFAAHDGFTWEVEPPGNFVRCEELSPASRAYERTMKELLTGMTLAQRREFIEEFFGTLTATGAVTLTDLTDRKLKEILRTARDLNQEPGVRKLVLETLELMTKGYLAEKSKALPRLRLPGPFRRKREPEAAPEAERPAESGWYS